MEPQWLSILSTIIFALVGFFVRNLDTSVKSLANSIAQLTIRLAAIDEKLKSLEDLEKMVADHDRNLVAIETILAAKRKPSNRDYRSPGN